MDFKTSKPKLPIWYFAPQRNGKTRAIKHYQCHILLKLCWRSKHCATTVTMNVSLWPYNRLNCSDIVCWMVSVWYRFLYVGSLYHASHFLCMLQFHLTNLCPLHYNVHHACNPILLFSHEFKKTYPWASRDMPYSENYLTI